VWRAVEALQLPVLAHHHDFYWEREAYARPTTAEVGASLRSCFPPVGLQVTHLVINGLAQAELSRRGIASIVVPNVFDFDFPPAQDPPREDLLAHLGLSTREVVFLQATRIVRRKGVEIALELVARLGSSRFREALKQRVRDRGGTQSGQPVLLLPNLVEDQAYYDALHNLALRLGVDARFVSDRVASSRRPGCISLWDAYRCADFATYPSLVEGWGNQFLEAIWSRLPMAVYEYPVFISDIAPVGFRYVSLGHCHVQGEDGLVRIPEGVLWQAAHEAADVLSHPAKYRDIVDRNYALGKARFSFRTLSRLLDRAVQNALRGRGGALCEL
jgi:glycosyltransferase involved in cell wall biosynthesis